MGVFCAQDPRNLTDIYAHIMFGLTISKSSVATNCISLLICNWVALSWLPLKKLNFTNIVCIQKGDSKNWLKETGATKLPIKIPLKIMK